MDKYKKITKQPVGPSLTSKNVQDFEKRWGLALPGEYKDWLLECNGGVPDNQIISTLAGSVFVSAFFALDPQGKSGVDSELRRFGYHDDLVPAALEGGGAIVFISTRDGGVFLASSECSIPGADCEKIADSWTNFLNYFTEAESSVDSDDNILDQIVRDADAIALDRYLAGGGMIEQRHSSGETMLQLAVLKGKTDSLELLLSRGAKLDGALHKAARVGNIPMIEWLLGKGASLTSRNERGKLPEEEASMPFVRRFLMSRRENKK